MHIYDDFLEQADAGCSLALNTTNEAFDAVIEIVRLKYGVGTHQGQPVDQLLEAIAQYVDFATSESVAID